ncbi:MAG: sigma-54 dependent transcriptional regulator [Gemmatimonadota bacterium]
MTQQAGSPLRVLIVDDERSSRDAIMLCVEQLGHEPVAVANADEALSATEQDVFDFALVDLRLGSDSGLDLIETLSDQSPWLRIAVVTAHGSIETAVESIKQNAVDYLTKPISPTKLEATIRQISTVRHLEMGLDSLREEMERAAPSPILAATDPKMLRVYSMARRAAKSNATILIRGESGTGKGVLARAIHDWSARSDHPFATVNAPSLSRELLESELFGHVKGAFTGAVRSRRGRVATAQGGTLFLDEIGTLPADLQPKLLRVLQDNAYEPVGGDKTYEADVRWIVATNRDLEQAVEEEDFREDLYYRIRVIEIEVPPLRERPQDILPLAEHFLAFFGARYGCPNIQFSEPAARALTERAWPGNVRELQNAVERAVILTDGNRIRVRALPDSGLGHAQTADGVPMISLEEAERRHIEAVLSATATTKDAAKVLGVSTTTLWRRRRKHEL